jgi:hypothetical protein
MWANFLSNKSYSSYINPDATLLQSVQMPLKFKVHVYCKSGVYKQPIFKKKMPK